MLEGCLVFGGRPVFGGCPLFGGCLDSKISHGRSMSQGFGIISTLKLSGWLTNLVFIQLKEYPISLNCYGDIYL